MAFGAPTTVVRARPRRVAPTQALERWRYPLALVLGLLIAGGFLLIVAPAVYLYRDPDSSFYLEAARHFLDGRGLTVSAGLEKLPATSEPLALWPPGFPLLVAFGSAVTGVDPYWVAPTVSWISWALIPLALMFTLQGVLRTGPILAVAALAMISPGAIDFAWQPMTDLPFLLLTILSFGLLVRSSGDPPRLRLALLAGFIAGLAYAVRNAGIALVPAVVAAYAALALLRLISLRRALGTAAAWGLGFALAAAPLQLRNLLVFGGLQPYQMEPSTLGVLGNLRYLASATLNDLAALHGLIDAVVWRDGVLLASALAAVTLLWRLRGRIAAVWRDLPNSPRTAAVLLASHAAMAAAVVVAARSRYEWGEFIGLRHLLQLDWIFLAAGAVLLARGPPLGRRGAALAALLVTAVFGLRVSYAAAEIAMQRREAAAAAAPSLAALAEIPSDYRYRLAVKLAAASDTPLVAAVRGLPAGAILASNADDVVRVASGRVTQAATLSPECDVRAALRLSDGEPPPELLFLAFARRELLASGCWEQLRRADRRPPAPALQRPYLIVLDAEELQALPVQGR